MFLRFRSRHHRFHGFLGLGLLVVATVAAFFVGHLAGRRRAAVGSGSSCWWFSVGVLISGGEMAVGVVVVVGVFRWESS